MWLVECRFSHQHRARRIDGDESTQPPVLAVREQLGELSVSWRSCRFGHAQAPASGLASTQRLLHRPCRGDVSWRHEAVHALHRDRQHQRRRRVSLHVASLVFSTLLHFPRRRAVWRASRGSVEGMIEEEKKS